MKLTLATFIVSIAASSAFAPNLSEQPRTTTRLQESRREFFDMAAVAAIGTLFGGVEPALAAPRPMYLTEPTEEFKANEEKAMEFKRAQLLLKKEFVTALDILVAEKNDAELLEKDVRAIQDLVIKAKGLPLGIKKDDMYKMIRSKKAKGFWPTNVEIAYQSLINEVIFQQSPNLDKEMGNFYQ